MVIGKVHISNVYAQTVFCKTITKGIAGAEVALEYDEELWKGLAKKVVFTNGIRTVSRVDADGGAEVPPEVVDTVDREVRIGVCGVDAEKNLVIPTLWASLGTVREGVPVDADPAEEVTPPVWAQLLAMIGDLAGLKTDARENLVAAVNELVARGGEISAAEVQRIVDEYLAANMTEVELPAALPNPHALRFTGAVEASYDGSEEVTVEVPSGGGATDEQIASAVEAYMAEHPVEVSGLTQEQIAALDGMFKVCAYTEDASAAYAAFKSAFGISDGVEPDEPEYQQVEYIEFDGNSYIVTDEVGASNFGYAAEVEFPQSDSERCIMTLASATSGATNVGHSNVAGRLFFYTGSGDGTVAVTDVANLYTSKVKFTADFKYGVERNLAVEVDGETYTSNGTANKTVGTSQKFVVGSSGYNSCKYGFIGKIYSASYYADGELTCDLMPCYRKADGVIGMYDRVHGKFYTNAGTGTFVKGADVA